MWVIRGLTKSGVAALPTVLTAAYCRGGEALTLVLAQDGGMTVTKSSDKNYIVEILVTVALLGLALWAVCRSSRRV